MSSKDPPFMSPLLKHLLSKRNKLLTALEAGLLQPRIIQLIKENQLNRIRVNNKKHVTGSRLWLTGCAASGCDLSSLFSVNDINTHFQLINTDTNYVNC